MTRNQATTHPMHLTAIYGMAWRTALWAALLVFVTAGYFQNSRPGWNVNSQFALTLAVAQRGTLRIDDYHTRHELETGDKALIGGHYYSDKSPVTALLGVPAYLVYRGLTQLGVLAFSIRDARYWTTWWTAGLAAAVLAALLALAFAWRGVPPVRAARAGALWIAATPLLGYSILFFNYLPAGALALGGFLLVTPAWRHPNDCSPWRLLAGGLLLGLAAWTLNTLALAGLVLTVALIVTGAPLGLQAFIRRLAPWGLGGLLGIAGYFIYNYVVSGSFASLYGYEVDPFFREQMNRGLMGATWPRPLVAWLVTVHPFQGLFCWFPLATLALAGVVWMLRPWRGGEGSAGRRIEAGIALAILLGLLLYTSAYFMWWGGWAYAPRHLLPALPFLALGLTPWLNARRTWLRLMMWGGGVLGWLINLAAVALDPQAPPGLPQEILLEPERYFGWLPHNWIQAGPMAMLQKAFWGHGLTDANWGTALGLHGPASLAPLLAFWIAMWGLAGWWIGNPEATPDAGPETREQVFMENPAE